jgi:diguanylate cyclase (GGDEF)-like protein
MLKQVARIITDNIENIVRRWVDDLRQSTRTEVQSHMLTAEIVDSMKGVLANVAAAIAEGQVPGDETAPIGLISRLAGDEEPRLGASARSRGTKPLAGPLALAQQMAQASGKLRHSQGYVMHEVLYEYVKLREVIWDTLRTSSESADLSMSLDLARYVDQILDEIMLSAVESFHGVAIRDFEKRAIRDPLTQLYNKDYFQQRLHEEMRRALRYGQPMTLVMLDMDLLKSINDTYGHQAGDAVIVAVTKAICDTCRQPDIPCRYGGDEFAVILPETNKSHAMVFAERVQRAIANLTIVVTPSDQRAMMRLGSPVDASVVPTAGDEGNVPLTLPSPSLSIGLASFPEEGRNPETLIARADAALYKAKREGRNRISC